jgi:hypothetical protein
VGQELRDFPFVVFVWGPGVQGNTPQARKRRQLREDLESVVGQTRVLFSEAPELERERAAGDLAAEYVQARAADAVVVIPESSGSIAEAALYQGELLGKTIVFTTQRAAPGFARAAYSLLPTHEVTPEEWDECSRVRRLTREFVESLRVYKFRVRHPTRFDWDL